MFLTALLLAGCDSTGPTPTAEMPTVPDIPTGGCGLEEYAWQPFSTLGQIVEYERVPELELTVESIQIALELGGLPSEMLDLQHDVVTYRVRYTTQDRGETVESTMLLSYPDGEVESAPVLAWLHGTTGFNDECAPSSMGVEGGAFNLVFSSMGYVVVSPDYIGMNGFGAPSNQLHPYVIAEPTAVASLDAIRAAWTFQDEVNTPARATHETVLFGASEGGFAAFWSDRYQPHYLAEADVKAVVASVPPANLRGLAEHAVTVPGDATGGLAGALATWHDWYRMETPLEDILQADLAAALPPALLDGCDPGDIADGFESIDDVFTDAFVDAVVQGTSADFPEASCALGQNTVVESEIPYESTAPILYVVAEEDELVAAGPTRDGFQPLCDAGYSMSYIECARADHVDGAFWSLTQQITWFEERLAGIAVPDACVQHDAETCDLEAFDE